MHLSNRFIENPTEAEQRAIDALRAVEATGGSVDRVFAVVRSPALTALRDQKLRPARSRANHATASWLCSRQPKRGDYVWLNCPLHIDHTAFLQDRETGERVIISEPYSLSSAEILRIADQIREHGINVVISADSPWFPGRTVAVEYRRPRP